MSSGRKRFKLLAHRPIKATWCSSLGVPRTYFCPEFVVMIWDGRRFRVQSSVAVGVPYSWNETWGSHREEHILAVGAEIAQRLEIPWIPAFVFSWKMKDVLLQRLKGNI